MLIMKYNNHNTDIQVKDLSKFILHQRYKQYYHLRLGGKMSKSQSNSQYFYMLKLSPHPHVPLILGLLKTNSFFNLSSIKSTSEPSILIRALLSINSFTPGIYSIY